MSIETGEESKASQKEGWIGLAIVGGVVIAIGSLFVVPSVLMETSAEKSERVGGESINACEALVKDRLRAPSGARFYNVKAGSADDYYVTGFVDAENGFGGHTAYTFTCAGSPSRPMELVSLTRKTVS